MWLESEILRYATLFFRARHGDSQLFYVGLKKHNIWVDRVRATPYVVVRLLVTFHRETLKGIRCETGTAPQR
jgi:hypothetical protein